MFSLRRVKLSLLAPSPPEASMTAFSRAGASVPTSVSSGKNLKDMHRERGANKRCRRGRHRTTKVSYSMGRHFVWQGGGGGCGVLLIVGHSGSKKWLTRCGKNPPSRPSGGEVVFTNATQDVHNVLLHVTRIRIHHRESNKSETERKQRDQVRTDPLASHLDLAGMQHSQGGVRDELGGGDTKRLFDYSSYSTTPVTRLLQTLDYSSYSTAPVTRPSHAFYAARIQYNSISSTLP